MKHRLFRAAALAALTLSACGTPAGMPVVPVGADNVEGPVMAVDYTLVPARHGGYGLAATADAAADLAITRVTASSTRNAFFPATNLIDGNERSAWAPAADDEAPSLTLQLGATADVRELAIKLSAADVTVDVAVGTANGGWQVVATGLAPEPATLSDLAIASCRGDRVKLTFHGPEVADLLVCEVEVRGTKAAATPTTSPTASPTATPDACEPCAEPPVVHVPDEPCAVKGGGWTKKIKFKKQRHATLVCDVDADGRGTIVVHDRVKRVKKVGQVTLVKRHGNVAMLKGRCDDGATFTCTVVDGGEHGMPDTWSFACEDGTQLTGRLGGGAGHGGDLAVKAHAEADVLDVALPDLDDLDLRCDRDAEDDEDDRAWKRQGPKKGKGKPKHDD